MSVTKTILQRVATAAKVLTGAKGVTFTGEWAARVGMQPYTDGSGLRVASRSSLVAMCMTTWLMEYPQAPLVILNEKDQPDYNHAANEILLQPNPWMSQAEFHTLSIFYRLLTGSTLVRKLYNETGNFVGIEPRHRWEMRGEYDRNGRLVQWWHSGPNGETPVRKEDVCVLPWPMRDFHSSMHGVSPIQSAYVDLIAYEELSKFIYEFLANGAVPGTIVSNENGWEGNEEEQKAAREDFRNRFGRGGRGGVAFLEGKVAIERFSAKLDELAVDSVRATPETNVCGAFLVPPEYIGTQVGLKSATYANKRESRTIFTESRLAPMWQMDSARLSAFILGEYKRSEKYRIAFDTTTVEALNENAEKRKERAKEWFISNIITRDEARAVDGFEPIDKAPVFHADVTRAAAQLPPSPPAKGAGDRGIKSDDERKAYGAALIKAQDGHIDKLEKAINKAFEGLLDDIRKEIGRKAFKRESLDALSEENLKKLFLDGTEEERIALVEEMMRRAVSDASFDFNEVRSWLDEALELTATTSAEKISESYGTTREDIIEIITKNPNATQNELLELLGKYISEIGASRALTIATTTTTATTSTAQREAWDSIDKRRDDNKKIDPTWITMSDGKVRDSHASLDGVSANEDGLFDVGGDVMRGPGLGSQAKENVNCRCVLFPKTVKK